MAADGRHVVMVADDGTISDPLELVAREPYELHNYYAALGPLTFETQFVPMSLAQARAWRKVYTGHEEQLTRDEAAAYAAFEGAVHAAVVAMGPDGAFCRLSTRSPKDAAQHLDRDRVVQEIAKELRRVGSETRARGGDAWLNAQITAVRTALYSLSCCRSGADALALCAMSSRVVSDLKRALDHADELGWHLCMVVRRFARFHLNFELRGFVASGKLTALSQYYADVYDDILAAAQDQVADLVQAYFDAEVAPRLAELGPPVSQAAVVDFVVLDLDEIKVVELNPFSPSTGPALFDWDADADVLAGLAPFEFRVLDAVPASVAGTIVPWQSLIDAALESLPSC